MYTECAFCAGSLGGDGGHSGLGVGRRFSFDGWKSRAWVICQRCGRWNLTPLDTRLDTIDALDRWARVGRVAATSEQVTLVRVGPYDVVRIGRPPRVEMATWRYGERMKARRREQLKVYVPVAVAVVGVTIAINAAAGGGVGAMMGNLPGVIDGITTGIIGNRRVGGIEPPICARCGGIMQLRAKHIEHARFTHTAQADLALLLSCPRCKEEGALLEGHDAELALRQGMTYLNLKKKKASKRKAEEAAQYLDRHGGAEAFIHNTTRMERKLKDLIVQEALAVEMAVDEQAELRELERQWHEAEELADIADGLLVDPAVEEELRRLKGGDQPNG
jgi:hypothetical protein